MFLMQAFRRYLDIAYRPARAGIAYDENPTGGVTKPIIESMSAVLILYASYSELTDKLLKTFSLEQSSSASTIGRIVTCIFGSFVCLHIIFSRKSGSPTIFAYSKLQRLWGGVFAT